MFFFFNDTATTEIYTLSLHDALPICNDNKVHSPTNELIDLAYLQLIRVVGGGEMQLHVAMSIGSRAQFLIELIAPNVLGALRNAYLKLLRMLGAREQQQAHEQA